MVTLLPVESGVEWGCVRARVDEIWNENTLHMDSLFLGFFSLSQTVVYDQPSGKGLGERDQPGCVRDLFYHTGSGPW